jgi:murein DD-endopeptidase MepM/ murein hydrolase activator NlpD
MRSPVVRASILIGVLVILHFTVFRAGAPPAGISAGPCISAARSSGCSFEDPPVDAWVRPVDAPVWSAFRDASRPDHDGVDLGAERGTPIRAAAAGTVVRVRCDVEPASHGCDTDGSPQHRGCGWYVDLRHEGLIYTRYCHMLAEPVVTVGQVVAAGDTLGLVGSSGASSGPHLHFEVHLGDQSPTAAVDPVGFMADHGAPLAPA